MSVPAEAATEDRRTFIGGSDAGAILGVNPYRTPLDVYLEKRGEIPPFAGNAATHWGTRLEDVIADEYAETRGVKVRRRRQAFVHREHPFLVGHIDRSVDGQRMVFEAKTAGQYMAGKWGPTGSDQVPDEYYIQVAHYMAVTDYDAAELAVLIGGRDFRWYAIPRDYALEELILAREVAFWRDHVEAGVPPEPVNARDIETLYAIDVGESLVATPELETLVAQYDVETSAAKEHEARAESLKEQIQIAMGEHSTLLGGDGTPLVTWKKAKDSERVDTKRLKAEFPDIYQQVTKPVAGSRRFLRK